MLYVSAYQVVCKPCGKSKQALHLAGSRQRFLQNLINLRLRRGRKQYGSHNALTARCQRCDDLCHKSAFQTLIVLNSGVITYSFYCI